MSEPVRSTEQPSRAAPNEPLSEAEAASYWAGHQARHQEDMARIAELEEALRLALLWLPPIDVRMSTEAMEQLSRIRRAYQKRGQ
jgi:hypothetical protein